MGKACSKTSASALLHRKSTRTTHTAGQNGTPELTPEKPKANTAPEAAAESGASNVGGGIDAVRVVTVEERIQPVELVTDSPAREAGGAHEVAASKDDAETVDRPKHDGEKISVMTVDGQEGAAPVAVIRQEKVLREEGEKGEGVMKVSVSEAIITADLPGLPATIEGVSPADLELLRNAHEHVKRQHKQGIGAVAVDTTDAEKQPVDAGRSQPGGDTTSGPQTVTGSEDVETATAYGYLLYSSMKDGGSLFFLWSKDSLDAQAGGAGKDQVILLSFVPAPHKRVPKIKFSAQLGKSLLLTEIETKWEVWKKSDKTKYYAAWTQAFKICDDFEAVVTLRQWSADWPPPVRVALLHVGPTGTNSVILHPNRPTNLNAFSYLAVLPADAANSFKGGNISTEKKFVDSATTAGGASLRLVRRGYGAALDQDDLLKWLKEDGIEIPPDQKGLTLGGDRAQYERRSVDLQGKETSATG